MLPTWLQTIHHDGSYVSDLYPRLGETVQVCLRTPAEAPINRLFLRTFPDGEQALTPMTHSRRSRLQRDNNWQVDLPIREPIVHYRFVIEAEDGVWWYSANGVTAYDPLDAFDFKIIADYRPPAWVHEAVFYQIFPDRFANGDPTNDPQPSDYEYAGAQPQTFAWGAPPDPDTPFPVVFYGGDLHGIADRLDHLQRLGVNCLYLNPIFTSFSNHKYDGNDYEQVDVHLGGDAALVRLREALSDRDMRYLLDIVPNHCGYWHPWFQRARVDANAPEAEFFTFHNHPDEYESWLGVWTLPKLNYASELLRERMLAVFRQWLEPPFSADGWRVDVANMLGRQGKLQIGTEITQAIRATVKTTNPNAYFMGENFFDQAHQLQGDQYDGMMNYAGFTFPLLHWLCGYTTKAWGMRDTITSPTPWPTEALTTAWRERMAVVPWAIALQQFNLLGSHDTSRIRTLLKGNRALQKLAVTVQFAFPGVPCIYYGDEIGMVDDQFLEQRGCMLWDETDWDNDLFDFYTKLITLRRKSDALQRGGFEMLATGTDWFAFQREWQGERVIVVANRSEEPANLEIPLRGVNGDLLEIFAGDSAASTGSGQAEIHNKHLIIPVHPQGATLWIQNR